MAMAALPDPRGDRSAVFISAEASARLVDRIGCFTTTAFVAVALDAAPDDRGALVATTSARSLARRLHIAKDTAAGVLGVLVKRGYLRRLTQPRAGGRFAPARYVVKPPAGFTVIPCPASEDTAASTTAGRAATTARRTDQRRRGRRSDRGEPSQLGLFATASEITDGRSQP